MREYQNVCLAFVLKSLTPCCSCGLRYARSRAKKEGGPTRRRKDKVMNTMSNKSDHSPSTSPVNVPFSAARRSSVYDDNMSFMPGTSASSATDAFSHHPDLNGMKQSPSPTGATTTFAAYPPAPPDHHAHDHRAPFAHHAFYPSLPNIDMPHGSQATTLPRMDATMPYSSRIAPNIHATPSPAPHSQMSPNPYDRERRDKGYEPIVLPPTPLAADGRGQGKY